MKGAAESKVKHPYVRQSIEQRGLDCDLSEEWGIKLHKSFAKKRRGRGRNILPLLFYYRRVTILYLGEFEEIIYADVVESG